MSSLLVVLKLAFTASSSAASVVPHYLWKEEAPSAKAESVTIPAPVFRSGFLEEPSDDEAVDAEGARAEIPRALLSEERARARAVFEARAGAGGGAATAFLVGEDLVLTNRHVLKRAACGEFAVFTESGAESPCREVVWCSDGSDPDLDACLVRIDRAPLGEGRPPLPLSSRAPSSDEAARLLRIGNTLGLGLQAAWGEGLRLRGGSALDHGVVSGSGDSGAPLLGPDGVVVAIHFGRIDDSYDPVSRGGMASRADRILAALDAAGKSSGVRRSGGEAGIR